MVVNFLGGMEKKHGQHGWYDTVSSGSRGNAKCKQKLKFYLHSVVKQHSRLYKMAINCGFSKNGPDFTQMFDMLLIDALLTCFCKFEMCPNNKTCIQEERVSPSVLKKTLTFWTVLSSLYYSENKILWRIDHWNVRNCFCLKCWVEISLVQHFFSLDSFSRPVWIFIFSWLDSSSSHNAWDDRLLHQPYFQHS